MSRIIWDLEKYLDIQQLEGLHLEICSGICHSVRDESTRLIPHHEANDDLLAALNFKNSEGARISEVRDIAVDILNDTELALYQKLNYNQKRKFLELYKNAYNEGEFIRIRFTRKEHLQEKFPTFYSDKTQWTENAVHFPQLINWIKGLPFIDIGRILIFVTKHHLPGDLHYDRRDDWLDGKHHFIWFNPFNQKNFCIFDGYNKIKVESKAIFFDTSYIHGSLKNDKTVYSLRIDGHLSREFCELTGIPWSPR